MADIFQIMFDVISPIFIVVGASMFISRRFKPDPQSLSTFVVYLFIPALAFNGVATSDLSGSELGGIAGVAFGVVLVMTAAGLVIARFERYDRNLESGFIVSIILVNAANYGIPLNRFAFGEEGAQLAVIYYVMTAMIGSALGVYFASRGQATVRDAFMNVLKVPITYAAVLGLIVNLADINLPLPLSRSLDITAEAAVPGMLALLGLQLGHVSIHNTRWRPVLTASFVRLILGAVVAYPLARLFGLSGVTLNVAVVESAMPTAVLAIALATEFKSDAEFVSTTTLVGTLLSIVSLSVLLALLM